MARGGRRRRWRWLRRVALCLAAAALVAAALNLPAEHRDYVAARLLLDALPNPPFHLPATAAGRPVTRTIQLGQGTAATTTASLWLPTRGSRLPGIVVAVGAAPLGRHDPHVVQLARAFVRAGRAVLVPDLTLRTGTLDAADLQRVTAAFQALAARPPLACGCRIFGHFMRPAHTHGSVHRADLAVRPSQPTGQQLIRRTQAAAAVPSHGADGARCSGRRTRPAPTPAGDVRR